MYVESSTTPVTVARSSPRIAGYAGRPFAITMTTPEAYGVAACTPGTRDTSLRSGADSPIRPRALICTSPSVSTIMRRIS